MKFKTNEKSTSPQKKDSAKNSMLKNFFSALKEKNKEKDISDPKLGILLENRPTEKQTILPTLIKEVDNSDNAKGTKLEYAYDDYMVEVGSTIGDKRYYKSFFGKLTTDSTYFGMFNDLYLGNFGIADCDIAIHSREANKTFMLYKMDLTIKSLRVDLSNASDPTTYDELFEEISKLEARRKRLKKNLEKLYSTSIQVTLSSNSLKEIKKTTNSFIRDMSNNGVYFTSADTQQVPAIMSLTPCDNTFQEFVHTFKPVETSAMADMYPYGFGSINHDGGFIMGENMYGKPVPYNSRSWKLRNYNSITFGVSGAGKSMANKIKLERGTFVNIEKKRTAIIDYEKENMEWMRKLGLPYLELSAAFDTEYSFNMFSVPRLMKMRTGQLYADLDDSINSVLAAILKLFVIVEHPVKGSQKLEIKQAIFETYQHKGFTYDADSIYQVSQRESGLFTFDRTVKTAPQLSDLYEILGQSKYSGLSEHRNIIKYFTQAGTIKGQTIFDCQTKGFDIENSPIIGVSVDGLDEVMRPLALQVVKTSIYKTYERLPKHLEKDIYIDEAQNLMEIEEDATQFEKEIRIARRRNIGMHPITQGFEVFLREDRPQGLGIMKNCATKMLLRQDVLDIEAIDGKFPLPAGVKSQLLNFDSGEMILMAGDETEWLRTNPTASEYELFNTNPNESEIVSDDDMGAA